MRCFNCILRVQRIQKHAVSDLSLQQKEILKDWLALQQLPVDAVICHACFLILNESNSVPGRRRFGHTDVCIGCGVSVFNKRHFNLEPTSPLLHVFEWSTRLLGYRNQVCRPCWLRGNRRVAQVGEVIVEIPFPPEQPLSPIVTWEAPSTDPAVHLGSIFLPNYKRSANTSRHCIYNTCRNSAGHLVPTFIKVMLIKEYNFYVPKSARVCEMHLLGNTWQSLPEIHNTLSVFTATQIQDIINLAKKEITFDFEYVHEMPNHICHYWTGLNVSEFLTLSNELSSLNNYVTSPKSSLAIYLTKLRTGDSNKRLAALFQMSRNTLERRINKVREYLVEHFIPLHTDADIILLKQML